MIGGRCFRSVDFISKAPPKLIAIDEETDHKVVHACRFGKANGAAHEPLDPGPQVDMFALDGLRVLFPDHVLLRGEMPLVGTPLISINWLQVLGTTETPDIDQGVRHQFHPVVTLLDVLEPEEQPLEFVLPRKRPLDALP